jgi:hypothetical protein
MSRLTSAGLATRQAKVETAWGAGRSNRCDRLVEIVSGYLDPPHVLLHDAEPVGQRAGTAGIGLADGDHLVVADAGLDQGRDPIDARHCRSNTPVVVSVGLVVGSQQERGKEHAAHCQVQRPGTYLDHEAS